MSRILVKLPLVKSLARLTFTKVQWNNKVCTKLLKQYRRNFFLKLSHSFICIVWFILSQFNINFSFYNISNGLLMLLTNYVRYIDTQKFQFFTWFTNRSVQSLMCNLIMLQHLMKEKKEWMRNHLPSIFILTNKIVEGFFYFFRSRLFLDMQLPTRYIKLYISYINLRSESYASYYP